MCGIAGIVNATASRDELRSIVERMAHALRHRGPDDEGVSLPAGSGCALAHTRLSILDLSDAGHQPMISEDERWHLVFNGEIYNFHALRSTLEEAGVRINSGSDTEVLLKLFAREGKSCVSKLRGMFAFAIWDNAEKRLTIARDPLGIKPLYFSCANGNLLFASEIRSLMASQLIGSELNPRGLNEYLLNGYIPDPWTILNDIESLEAGLILTWKDGQTSVESYWQLPEPDESEAWSEQSAKEAVRAAFEDSIRHHFVSDVPVGLFLSGGIDSTAVLAVSRHVREGEIRSYSIAFNEEEFNEGPVARRLADEFGTSHTEHLMTPEEGKRLFREFLSVIDQPTADGFNTYCVSRLARENGTKVVLSGLGGDELFAGYPSFYQVPKMMRAARAFGPLAPARRIAGSFLHGASDRSQVRRVADFLEGPASLEDAWRCFRGLFTSREAELICERYGVTAPVRNGRHPGSRLRGGTIRENVGAQEFSRYMRGQLLRDSDVMSMSHGLELRVPFVDKAFVETVMRIPGSIRLKQGKKFLIEAIPELPYWMRNLPKKGFMFPFQKWVSEEWQEMFGPVEKRVGNSVPLNAWARKYSLFVLEHWLREVGAQSLGSEGVKA